MFVACMTPVCMGVLTSELATKTIDKSRVIPVAIHGDEADSHRRRTFSVLTMSSLTTSGNLFDVKVLCFALDNSQATPQTGWTLEKWIALSLAELQNGVFSELDPWGEPFPVRKAFDKQRSGQIADGWRCVPAVIKGDEKWIQRTFFTNRSWVSANPCLHCGATTAADSPLLYTPFGPSALHRSAQTSSESFVAEVCRVHTWTLIPGFHIMNIQYDWLHIVDLCIVPECAASALILGCCSGFGVCVCACRHVVVCAV